MFRPTRRNATEGPSFDPAFKEYLHVYCRSLHVHTPMMKSNGQRRMNRLLLIGPVSPPLGGEALAFCAVVDFLKERGEPFLLIDKAGMKSSPFFTVLGPFLYFFSLVRYGLVSDTIYMTSSTNPLGKIRDIITAAVAGILRIRVILHMHGNTYLSGRSSGIIDSLIARSLNSFKKIIILSEGFKEHLDFVQDKRSIVVVPNSILPGTLPVSFASADEYRSQKNHRLTMLYMSHVLPSKGLFDVLEALVLLSRDGVDFEFHFAGTIIEEHEHTSESITAAVARYSAMLGEKFIVHGFVQHETKWDLLRRAHVFLLPTQFHAEGFPISILEAMYFGQTIITTRWRAIPDIVREDVNGFFVEYHRPDKIHERLNTLSKDRGTLERIGMENHSEVLRTYMPERFKTNILSQLLNGEE
jgi:glycosyltransferase involved in cell wall biosynthesis